jgi:hypothetical protein
VIGTLLALSLLSQTTLPYTRSRVDSANPASQCLWWLEQTTIVYHQNADGNPWTPGDQVFTAFDKAVATWQAQLDFCGNLSLQEGARTSSRKVGYFDPAAVKGAVNENLVLYRQKKCTGLVATTDACWKDDDCGNVYDCWQFNDTAIAITTTSFSPSSGRIVDSDIELNEPSFYFTTVDSPVCSPPNYLTTCVATDVQNTTTHELGHLLGLGHFNAPGSTMSPHADPGELTKRVLDTGTKQFVCDVYPKGQVSLTCFTDQLGVEAIGNVPSGCSALPGNALALLALVALWRRKR